MVKTNDFNVVVEFILKLFISVLMLPSVLFTDAPLDAYVLNFEMKYHLLRMSNC